MVDSSYSWTEHLCPRSPGAVDVVEEWERTAAEAADNDDVDDVDADNDDMVGDGVDGDDDRWEC